MFPLLLVVEVKGAVAAAPSKVQVTEAPVTPDPLALSVTRTLITEGLGIRVKFNDPV
jgi:hypothetical protein